MSAPYSNYLRLFPGVAAATGINAARTAWNALPSFRYGPWGWAAANALGRTASNWSREAARSYYRPRSSYSRAIPSHGGLGRNRRYRSGARRRPRSRPRPEVKFRDIVDWSYAQGNEELFDHFTSIPENVSQGTQKNQRVGNRIEPLAIQLKAEVYVRYRDAGDFVPVRGTIYLVARGPVETPSLKPLVSQLWVDTPPDPTYSYVVPSHQRAMRNPDYTRQLRIIKSYPFTVTKADGVDSLQYIEDYIGKGLPRSVKYNDSGGVVSGDIFVMCIYDRPPKDGSGQAEVRTRMNLRFKYTDA